MREGFGFFLMVAKHGTTSEGSMKKYDRLWQDLNNLLAFLESYGTVERLVKDYFSQPNNDSPPKNVPKLVEEYFAKFGNEAPPQLLRGYMNKLQKHLDEAPGE